LFHTSLHTTKRTRVLTILKLQKQLLLQTSTTLLQSSYNMRNLLFLLFCVFCTLCLAAPAPAPATLDTATLKGYCNASIKTTYLVIEKESKDAMIVFGTSVLMTLVVLYHLICLPHPHDENLRKEKFTFWCLCLVFSVCLLMSALNYVMNGTRLSQCNSLIAIGATTPSTALPLL